MTDCANSAYRQYQCSLFGNQGSTVGYQGSPFGYEGSPFGNQGSPFRNQVIYNKSKKKKNRKKGYDRNNFRTEPYPVPLLSLPLGVQFNRQHFQNTLNQWNSQGNCQRNNQWNNQGNDGLAKLRYPNSEYHTVELHKGRETLAHHASEPRVPEFLRVKENSQSFDNRAFGQPGTRRVSFLDEHWITQHCDPRSLGRTSHTPHR